MRRFARSRWFPVALFAGVVAYVLVVGMETSVYDDALFFKRFARNFSNHGVFAWNAEEGPVHGNTSQLFQGLATGVAALAGDWYLLATKTLSAVLLVCAFALLVRLVRRRGGNPGILLFGLATPIVLGVVHTGMETALVLFVLALVHRFVPLDPARRFEPFRAAGLTTLVYLARPDAVLLPALSTLFGQARGRPRAAALYAVALGLGLGAFLLAFHVYYGSALPLAAYWKTLAFERYDPSFVAAGEIWKRRYLLTFGLFAAPLVWVAVAARAGKSRPLLVAVAGFVAYHALMTNEVMGYRARFYVPALVPLAVAAAFAWPKFRVRSSRIARRVFAVAWAALALVAFRLELLDTGASPVHSALPLGSIAAWLAGVGIAIAAPERLRGTGAWLVGALLVACGVSWLPPRVPRALADRGFVERAAQGVTTVRGLFDVEACLPSNIHVYHSEIGVPGVVLPAARITDLAGLMSNELTFERPRLDALCRRDRPEVLFLPHRVYAAANRELMQGECLRGYTRVVDASSSPLYVRSDLVAPFLACARTIWPFTTLRR
ncbi:MAG TPA: hypothetical protein VKY73_06655 [Polyangiaceae bacterium]|nr:hypothetical protein [Polyangiaceae bacterium]